jgi:hypothetical protein
VVKVIGAKESTLREDPQSYALSIAHTIENVLDVDAPQAAQSYALI